jgi:hypothetical protein
MSGGQDGLLDVMYEVYNTFQPSNTFTAWLLTSQDDWGSAQAIGTYGSDTSGTISCTIPAGSVTGGTYYVRVTSDAPADTSLASAPVSINTGTNIIADKNTLPAWRIYPNPVGNRLHIQSTTPLQHITLINTSGSIAASKHRINATETSLETSELPAGMYILKVITTDGRVKTVKIERINHKRK